MLLLAATLFAAFVLGATLQDDVDDDDQGGDGGLMTPIMIPSS